MRRSDAGYWQPVAGGGETGETVARAAVREIEEEVGATTAEDRLIPIEPVTFISTYDCFGRLLWGPRVTVIPQYFFGFEMASEAVTLSSEHIDSRWLPIEAAKEILYWPDNRRALTCLHRFLTESRD